MTEMKVRGPREVEVMVGFSGIKATPGVLNALEIGVNITVKGDCWTFLFT
ncbi:hypothetical protein HanRHA438_Chr06g0251331 [Helianthus annuus]|nr:hypothetical protein HanRHA438_Chr06g0251331 [Helianthus annuus]